MPPVSSTLAADTVVRRAAAPVETTIGSEIVLMSLDSGQCFGLGETGSDVWRLLAQPITLAEIGRTLRESYQAPAGVLESDVAELVGQLHALHLIEFLPHS